MQKNQFVVWAVILFSDRLDVLNSIEGTGYHTSNMVTYNLVEYNKRHLVWNNKKYTLY
jgi:hypothetical protein